MSATSSPAAASQSRTPPLVRNPIATATPMTATVLSNVWIMLPITWPVSRDARAIPSVRNRSTMPSVMSTHTETDVSRHPDAIAIRMIPGAT